MAQESNLWDVEGTRVGTVCGELFEGDLQIYKGIFTAETVKKQSSLLGIH